MTDPSMPYPLEESREILPTDPFYDGLDEALAHHFRVVEDEVVRDTAPT